MTKREKILAAVTMICILSVISLTVFFCLPENQRTPSSVPDSTETPPREPPLPSPQPTATQAPLPEGFSDALKYIPDAVVALSYYSEDNFMGRRVKGYEANRAILTTEACTALKKAADTLRDQGYLIYIYDAYRPTDAVKDFIAWGEDEDDMLRKEDFYPTLTKKELFSQYISSDSKHSRGSTVDLTIIHSDGTPVSMGCRFDYFHELAHTFTALVDAKTHENRMILRRAMEAAGFQGSSTEWWHFRLTEEPYPHQAFNFYVK